MINAAIVGMGWWGQTLVESVSGGSDKIRFVAGVARRATEPLEAFSREHGLKFYQEYGEALSDPGIDAVVLATPHSVHADQVVAAAEAGKHVFCEKPFALRKSDRRTRGGGNREGWRDAGPRTTTAGSIRR